MSAEKARFLCRSGLEAQPGWFWLRATTPQQIKERFPDVEVASQPPPWLTEAELGSLRDVDIDDLDDDLLLALRRRYQTYDAPGHVRLDEAIAKALPCRLCSHLPAEHRFDRLCPVVELPAELARRAAALPEHSYGAVKVTMTLKDGRVFRDVFVANGRVIKVGEYPVPPGGSFRPIPFTGAEIADLEPSA